MEGKNLVKDTGELRVFIVKEEDESLYSMNKIKKNK